MATLAPTPHAPRQTLSLASAAENLQGRDREGFIRVARGIEQELATSQYLRKPHVFVVPYSVNDLPYVVPQAHRVLRIRVRPSFAGRRAPLSASDE